MNTTITHIYFRNVLISFVAAANYYNISLIKKLYKKICLIMRFTSQIGSVASTVVFSKMHNKNPGIINVTLNIYKIYFRITIPNDLSFLQCSFQCKSLFLFFLQNEFFFYPVALKPNQWFDDCIDIQLILVISCIPIHLTNNHFLEFMP